MSTTEWFRFEQVTDYIPTGHNLFRSSAPNYNTYDNDDVDVDKSQMLTESAVLFLQSDSKGIDSIISFNKFTYTAAESQLLNNASIEYLHIPLPDLTAPTITQLNTAFTFFNSRSSTLVHCGYGHGRTGTGVTAIQLHATAGKYPLEIEWGVKNHVEAAAIGQFEVLRNLRDNLLLAETGEVVSLSPPSGWKRLVRVGQKITRTLC